MVPVHTSHADQRQCGDMDVSADIGMARYPEFEDNISRAAQGLLNEVIMYTAVFVVRTVCLRR